MIRAQAEIEGMKFRYADYDRLSKELVFAKENEKKWKENYEGLKEHLSDLEERVLE